MAMTQPPRRHSGGYTLTELAIVIVVLALLAAVATPGARPADPPRLELAAGQLAAAIRHARGETLRTGIPHGFRQPGGSLTVEVFRLDTSTVPATPVFDVRHPLDKTLYRVDLSQQSATSVDSLSRNASYRGSCSAPDDTWFDASGAPRCLGGDDALVDDYELVLELGNSALGVRLHGVTGRVVAR